MDKKKYATPSLKLVNIQTCGMLAAGPDEIDDYSTFDSF